METPQVKTLYTLKTSAGQHLKHKQFSQASVYYVDIVTKFDNVIEKLEQQQEMEQLIKEVKLPAHKNLALCHLKLNENMACVQQCEEVLKVEPNCIKTLYRIAKAYMNLQQYLQAQKYLKRGFAINPNEDEIQKALAQIQAAKNPVKPTNDSFLSLKKLLAIILYFPLLIFNTFLAKIFGVPTPSEEKIRVD